MTGFEARIYKGLNRGIVYRALKGEHGIREKHLVSDVLGIMSISDIPFGRDFAPNSDIRMVNYIIVRDSEKAILSGDRFKYTRMYISEINVKIIGLSYFVDMLINHDLEAIRIARFIYYSAMGLEDFNKGLTELSDELVKLINEYVKCYFNIREYRAKCLIEANRLLEEDNSEIDQKAWWDICYLVDNVNRVNFFNDTGNSIKVLNTRLNGSADRDCRLSEMRELLKLKDNILEDGEKASEELKDLRTEYKAYFMNMFFTLK